jgi:N-carbamoylputrescine amidase
MMLLGAEVLLYPTAIGSEPHDPTLDTAAPWRRAMQGHAVSNVVPVVGANRTGHEQVTPAGQTFYGSSFISDHRGDLVAAFGREEEGALVARFDLDYLDRHRAAWGFFRDRRTDLYEALGPAKVFGGR